MSPMTEELPIRLDHSLIGQRPKAVQGGIRPKRISCVSQQGWEFCGWRSRAMHIQSDLETRQRKVPWIHMNIKRSLRLPLVCCAALLLPTLTVLAQFASSPFAVSEGVNSSKLQSCLVPPRQAFGYR